MRPVAVLRKGLLVFGLLGASLAIWATPAPAQAPDQQGWWWVAGATGIAPPGVPADGLYVAGNPSGPQGVSALTFTLAGGGGAGTLRLDLAGAPSGTPVIGLCRVASGWKPAQGGSLADAPACLAGGTTVAGQASADGQSFTFAIGQLGATGVLDVAVVPGTDANGGNPTFSVAFEKPAADALAPAGSGGVEHPSPAPAEPSPSFSAQPAFDAPMPAFEPQPPDAPLTGSVPRTVAPSVAPGVALPRVAPATDADADGSGWRIAGFLVLAVTAVAYHRLSTTPDRPPRSLVSFGQLAGEEQS